MGEAKRRKLLSAIGAEASGGTDTAVYTAAKYDQDGPAALQSFTPAGRAAPLSGLLPFACYILWHNTCWGHCAMTNAEWFAFVILPVAVMVLGCIGAWAARRFIP